MMTKNHHDKLHSHFEASEASMKGKARGGYDLHHDTLKPSTSGPVKHFAGRAQATWEPEDVGYEFHQEGMGREGPSIKVIRK
jgi:hypothetical protein